MNKNLLFKAFATFAALLLLTNNKLTSQNIAVNSTGAVSVASAMLDITSTTSGLLVPRMTAAQRAAIAAPATSLLVYQTDAGTMGTGYYFYNGAAWVPFGTNNGGWGLSGNTGTTASTSAIGAAANNNFLGTTDAVALVIATSGLERMRILGAGNILFNTTTALAGTDLVTAVGSATFPDPINAYTGVGGATGVYGGASSGTGIGVWGDNSTVAGAAVGFGGFFSNNQTGGSALAGSLQALSYFAGSSVSGITVGTVAGGRGAIAACDNATGIGVQGQTAGAGAAIGVFGIASGANRSAVGIYGVVTATPVSGTGFTSALCRKAIYGQGNAVTGNYNFGLFGNGGISTRSGGVFGFDGGATLAAGGSCGYYAASLTDYGIYGFGIAYQTGIAGGMIQQNDYSLYASLSSGDQKKYRENNSLSSLTRKMSYGSADDVDISTWSNASPNSMIGLGIYGGVMGGWIKGLVYGANLSGVKYGAYVHGKTITNNIIATLNKVEGSDNRVATFASTSMKVEVTNKGKAKLNNGKVTISFDKNFAGMASSEEPIIITVTPLGSSKGLFIEQTSATEFTVAENDGGNSNVEFNWIAIAVKKGFENPQISEEILANDFEEKMNGDKGVMYNDSNPAQPEYHLWYDGKQVRFDMPPNSNRVAVDPMGKAQTPIKIENKKKILTNE